jgi:hypothetical protein
MSHKNFSSCWQTHTQVRPFRVGPLHAQEEQKEKKRMVVVVARKESEEIVVSEIEDTDNMTTGSPLKAQENEVVFSMLLHSTSNISSMRPTTTVSL